MQRSIGTIFGVGVAMCIGYLHPQSYLIALFNMILTILTEFFIAKNYALATIFFTPNAILIAEASSSAYTTANLATARIIILKQKIEIDFNNFNLAYNTALGEIPNDEKRLEMMWPIVFVLEQINYLLAQYSINEEIINISNKQLEDIVFVYESMANNIELGTKMDYREIKIYNGMESLCKEINSLQEYIVKISN
ncbi:FUSC family protein [Clostridium sp. SM-530-WT-3G]|uniref:FUSC family protein n=1 Tax=Clostridium sp. SM-530-WT-3G TaxID=2725303 RepID=UPI00325B9CAC